ncbi:MAG: MBL fold metallo-hydrolase [Limisphaerales bacterium]
MSALTIRYDRGGVHLPRLGLWLDARQSQGADEKVFVSHAHSDHLGRHREVIVSAATARFLRLRLRGERVERVLAFGEPASFRGHGVDYQITLWPAGHILGSAMAFIEAEGETLLYTGDFKLRRGLSAEPCEPQRADILIMETTFGRPGYEFPPADEVIANVVGFCRAALDQCETPVLLAYSLGKSQELLRHLSVAGLPIMGHEQVCALTRIYEQFGQQFPPYEKFNPATISGKVLICPPQAKRSRVLGRLERVRTAIISGWAIEPGCRYRYQTDAAFALSDHASFSELVAFVQRVTPGKVYTLHGFAADFAQTLRDRGFDAHALSEPDQLGLRLT